MLLHVLINQNISRKKSRIYFDAIQISTLLRVIKSLVQQKSFKLSEA
jgi:hypothetical protein